MNNRISYNYLERSVTKIGEEFSSLDHLIGKTIKEIICGEKSNNDIIEYNKEDNTVAITCLTNECASRIKFSCECINYESIFSYICPFCNVKMFTVKNDIKFLPKAVLNSPAVNIAIMGNIIMVIDNLLGQYCGLIYDYHFVKTEDTIDIYIKENVEKDEEIRLAKIFFLHSSSQIQIPNIFIGSKLKNKGIGKKIISLIFQFSQQYNYNLFIVDMVESFLKKMIKRGAIKIDCDTVQITDETDLCHKH